MLLSLNFCLLHTSYFAFLSYPHLLSNAFNSYVRYSFFSAQEEVRHIATTSSRCAADVPGCRGLFHALDASLAGHAADAAGCPYSPANMHAENLRGDRMASGGK